MPEPESAPHVRSSTTRALLSLYRRGRESALELLFKREIPGLRRWARGRLPRWARGVVDTADLVQDVFARTIPQLTHFEPQREKALQAYLRAAVENRIRDELRRANREPIVRSVNDYDASPSSDASPMDTLMIAEDQRLLARSLARLNPAEQSAIVARLQMGYTYEQIALLLRKRSPDAARMFVNRAVAKLIEEMKSDPGTWPE